MKNPTASIQNKLKEIGNQENLKYDKILFRYFHERLLYRLSISPYKDKLCLKGGNLIYALEQEKSRPTTDIDFLGLRISSDLENLRQIFIEICNIECQEDMVVFNLGNLIVESFNEDHSYSGVKLRRIEARFVNSNTHQNLTIEIGFGDFVTPEVTEIIYPTLLDMESPKIKAYPIETVIAEKFQIMIDKAESNSRMKDFYDVYKELRKENFDKETLEQAIINTFTRRKTPYSENHPLFKDEFANDEDRLKKWKDFLKNNMLDETLDFKEVLNVIKEHLHLIYEKMDSLI